MADKEKKFYIYAFYDGASALYVGKGSGYRAAHQKKRFRVDPVILERFDCEDAAYAAEVKWMQRLKPTENKKPGGSGGRCLKSKLTKSQRSALRAEKVAEGEILRIGVKRYVAQFLLTKISELNADGLGVSRGDLSKIRAVAAGATV